jgi:hypothetical protein
MPLPRAARQGLDATYRAGCAGVIDQRGGLAELGVDSLEQADGAAISGDVAPRGTRTPARVPYWRPPVPLPLGGSDN